MIHKSGNVWSSAYIQTDVVCILDLVIFLSVKRWILSSILHTLLCLILKMKLGSFSLMWFKVFLDFDMYWNASSVSRLLYCNVLLRREADLWQTSLPVPIALGIHGGKLGLCWLLRRLSVASVVKRIIYALYQSLFCWSALVFVWDPGAL